MTASGTVSAPPRRWRRTARAARAFDGAAARPDAIRARALASAKRTASQGPRRRSCGRRPARGVELVDVIRPPHHLHDGEHLVGVNRGARVVLDDAIRNPQRLEGRRRERARHRGAPWRRPPRARRTAATSSSSRRRRSGAGSARRSGSSCSRRRAGRPGGDRRWARHPQRAFSISAGCTRARARDRAKPRRGGTAAAARGHAEREAAQRELDLRRARRARTQKRWAPGRARAAQSDAEGLRRRQQVAQPVLPP